METFSARILNRNWENRWSVVRNASVSMKVKKVGHAKYKVTVARQQVVTAQCLFCEFTGNHFRDLRFLRENALGQTEVFPQDQYTHLLNQDQRVRRVPKV